MVRGRVFATNIRTVCNFRKTAREPRIIRNNPEIAR
jgi:hypothetical protein